ncbi:hypothetical protein GCM10023148_35310 [Actinokineospora soli]
MPAIVVLSADSTVTAPIVAALRGQDHDVRAVAVHALPPVPLLRGEATHPAVAAVVDAVTTADAVVLTTPVRKSSCSGLLKSLLDLLPQPALLGKPVLAVATGQVAAHAAVLDHALSPPLARLGAHPLPRVFIPDREAGSPDLAAVVGALRAALVPAAIPGPRSRVRA